MSKKIGRILGILLSISILATGICMIIQCLSIYNSGDKPYSREVVAQAFSEISIPVFICISLVAITFIYNICYGNIWDETPKAKNNSFIINAILHKKDIRSFHNDELKKERKIRLIHCLVLVTLLVAGFGCFTVYALNPDNYHQSDINGTMINAMTIFSICIAVPFVYSIVCTYVNNKSREREIKIIRELIKDAPDKNAMHKDTKNNVYIYIKIFILVIAVGVIIYGLISGGTADVLTKAINICTECIGLG